MQTLLDLLENCNRKTIGVVNCMDNNFPLIIQDTGHHKAEIIINMFGNNISIGFLRLDATLDDLNDLLNCTADVGIRSVLTKKED